MFDPNASQITITETAILLRGAVAPAPIVDRRLDGRLLVARPGKKNAWLVLDGAFVPALLAKRIKAPSKCVEERIVVLVEDLDATVALVEEWIVGGGREKDEAAAAKRAASAAKRAATLAAKAEAERQAQWEAEAPAREAAAAARAEADRARQTQWAQERRARELAAAAARRAEDARMAEVRANRAIFNVAVAPAVGEAFEAEGDGMRHSDRVMICESLGRSWVQAGVSVCYAYGRPATAEEAAAYHADRPRSGYVTLLAGRAPAVGDRFRLRDGSTVVRTGVGRPFTVDESLDEEYTSFYSSELWEQRVVRVDYEHVDATIAPAMVQQPAQQQQACAAAIAPISTVSAAKAEVDRLEAKCAALRENKAPALALLRECRKERVAAVAGEIDACPGVCWTNEERAQAAYDEACERLDRCTADYWEALDYLSDEEREEHRVSLKDRIAQGVAMALPQTLDFPIDFDAFEPRTDLVSASADDATVILAGMEAERFGGDRLAGEIAAAAAGPSTTGDFGEFLRHVCSELMDPEPEPRPALPVVTSVEAAAFRATKAWLQLFERDRDAPLSVRDGALAEARYDMLAAHARLSALVGVAG